MNQKIILVLDCGATNVRTIAVNTSGKIIARDSLPNNTQPDPENKNMLVWDVREIWDKVRKTTGKVLQQLNKKNIAAVTVTTFGVDGAPFSKDGDMLYPVISWQCLRTEPVMKKIGKYISLDKLFSINGVQPFHFNTINKLIWLKENHPDILEKSDSFLFLPSIFAYFLTGQMITDITMAGTSMLTDLRSRNFSEEIFERIGVSMDIFPDLVEPGEHIGRVTDVASRFIGIPAGIPVIATGHDTQFAIFGSGAKENIPVLSSGTWEILMVRASKAKPDSDLLRANVTTELDTLPGFYDIGIQWIASGMLEWVKKIFFADIESSSNVYDKMIMEAALVQPGSDGVRIDMDMFTLTGEQNLEIIRSANGNISKGQVYRAALEALSFKTRKSLGILEKTGDFSASYLICVGGGSKNKLWNQIRADVLQIPVKVVDQKETTVLGAALFAMSGIGLYESPDEARNIIDYQGEFFEPGKDVDFYAKLALELVKFKKSKSQNVKKVEE